jgi:hypothetical protein
MDELDHKATLNLAERASKKDSIECLARIWRDNNNKWSQCAKVKHVQEGENNTKYFHLIENGKHWRKKIL